MKKFFVRDGISVLKESNGNGILSDRSNRKKYMLDVEATKLFEIIYRVKRVPESLINSKWFIKYKDFFVNEHSNFVFRKTNCDIPLTDVQLEITQRCNLHCKHCYLGRKFIKHDLSLSQIFSVIDQASDLGCLTFHVTGGEPCLHPHINEILKYAYAKGMSITLFTNATAMNKRLLTTLQEVHVEIVRTSIDGADAEEHDMVRGYKGAYDKTMSTINVLKDMGIPVQINTVIHKLNIHNVDDIVNNLQDKELSFRLDSYVPMNGPKNDPLFITPHEFIESSDYYKSGSLKYTAEACFTNKLDFYCGAGNSYVFIKSNGTVVFCPTMPTGFNGGNVLEDSLENIWLNSKFFNHIRNVNCRFFKECPVNYICKGGCRSRSQLIFNDIKHPDIQMCEYMYKLTGIKSPALEEKDH